MTCLSVFTFIPVELSIPSCKCCLNILTLKVFVQPGEWGRVKGLPVLASAAATLKAMHGPWVATKMYILFGGNIGSNT
jgi:hypothetical protein